MEQIYENLLKDSSTLHLIADQLPGQWCSNLGSSSTKLVSTTCQRATKGPRCCWETVNEFSHVVLPLLLKGNHTSFSNPCNFDIVGPTKIFVIPPNVAQLSLYKKALVHPVVIILLFLSERLHDFTFLAHL